MGILAKLTASPTFKIWGGEKLSKIKQIKSSRPLGETWEISTHKDGTSLLGDKPLSDFCKLSYLFKYIDTSDNLSIQVHPGDEYASKHENEKGKTECWIILSAEVGSGIYLGLKEGITKKEFKTAIENNLEVDKYLNFVEVKAGDYFYVPYGAIHALGKGLTLAETQQSSGITYRVWDWNRVDKQGQSRKLHVDNAMAVSNFSSDFNKNLVAHPKNLFESSGHQKIVEHPEFKADLLSITEGETKDIRLTTKEGISLLSGEISIDGEDYFQYDSGICLDAGIISINAKSPSKIILIRE